ncbi:HEAT repeat domain-containing protein [Scytonema hofmannii FACHB-248]|uniref:HEAT repeat domain-containing protein n=1 Tax=Scytonema hofmannii FACHB-248 TaxID=1842502 RepID=A0ABR8GUX3_9CYAN|nr:MULTISPECIES: HEAT repeat domain-containing protein [Nostocales]MBD2607173.1 HEAT repeat domain-containing protein [Scytonema hofmannii FACHB-248]
MLFHTFSANPTVPILIEALDDEDCEIRERTVEVLGKIGDEKAISSLKSTLKDPDYSVIWRVAEALKLIQERCKFYNYEIAQSPSVEKEKEPESEKNRQKTINIYGTVGNLNAENVNIQGNQIGEQYNK